MFSRTFPYFFNNSFPIFLSRVLKLHLPQLATGKCRLNETDFAHTFSHILVLLGAEWIKVGATGASPLN